MDTTLRAARRAHASRPRRWFDDQLKGLRADFEDAQDRLASFQKEKGIIVTDERVDVENARLAELSTQALQAQNITYEAQSRSGGLAGRGRRHRLAARGAGQPAGPGAQDRPAARRGEARRSSRRASGPNHPQYQQQAVGGDGAARAHERRDAQHRRGLERAQPRRRPPARREISLALAAQRSASVMSSSEAQERGAGAAARRRDRAEGLRGRARPLRW